MKNLLLAICFFIYGGLQAQNADSAWFVNNYTKKEVYITMRDGVRLFTSVLMPKDTTELHPILMERTPYSCSPYGEDQLPWWFAIYYYINYFKEGWQTNFLDSLLNIYLIAKGYQNKDSLDPGVRQDIRNLVGFTINQDELKEKEGLKDVWLVVGKQVSDDDNLTVERNWLYGIDNNQHALILQFIIKGQGAGVLLSPGMFIEAEIVYFPSTTPLRALIKQYSTTNSKQPQQLLGSWKEVAEVETDICSQLPVRNERPYAIQGLVPVFYNNNWWLKDRNEDLISISEDFNKISKLLALSGGHSLDMVVLGKENNYQPIGVWHHQLYKAI